MAKKRTPTAVTIRSYQVGFGDCFLLTVEYGPDATEQRHVLIDYGSTAKPKNNVTMKAIAQEIADACGGKLHAVIATHRHRDHISGFGGATGKMIEALKPDVVVQPWTEHPEARPDAKVAPRVLERSQAFVRALDRMHAVAEFSLNEIRQLRTTRTVKEQLGFLGEDNLKNRAAIDTLMNMKAAHAYVHYGSRSGLERVLPGVKVHVLGPPNLKQSDAIQVQRSEDPDEFWHLHARAAQRSSTKGRPLFPRAAKVSSSALPLETRWFLPRLEAIRGEQLLEIVRTLDRQMNNTSVILLFEIGRRKLLFPGDAQLENWMYALKEAPNSAATRRLLAGVDFYKVGHHGSLNATPKSLWRLFRKRGEPGIRTRLKTAISTLAGKHGSADRDTEVPRSKLVGTLKEESDFLTTQTLTRKADRSHVITIKV